MARLKAYVTHAKRRSSDKWFGEIKLTRDEVEMLARSTLDERFYDPAKGLRRKSSINYIAQ